MPRKSKETVACQYYVWNIFIRAGVAYADGRRNTPNLGKHSLGVRYDNKGAVTKALRDLDLQMAIDHGLVEPENVHTGEEVRICEEWDQYMKRCERPAVLGGLSTSSQKRYRAVRDKHIEFCENQNVTSWRVVDKKHVERYAQWLTKNRYSDRTIYLECTLLKQIVKWLIEEEKKLPESHRIRLKLERSNDTDTYCYSSAEVTAMIALCREKGLDWLGDILITLATTGMRIGELCTLRWASVDLERNTITLCDNRSSGMRKKRGKAITTTKGKRSRKVPIHPRLLDVLVNLSRRSDGMVFSGPRGGRAKPDTIRTILVRDIIEPLGERFPTAADDIGFADGRLHSFRHYFVSQAFLGGASEGEIREWVGHADSRIVERYRHLSNEDAQRKMGKIEFLPSDEKLKADDLSRADNKNDEAGAPDVPVAE